MKQKDLSIFNLKAPFLQAVADAARFHSKYMTGLVELENAQEFVSKMARKYHLDIEKTAASRLRKEGQATCRMLIYKLPLTYTMTTDDVGISMPNSLCQWVMFASDGKHPIGDSGDVWRNHYSDRLLLVGGLELFLHTRPRQASKDGKPAPKNVSPSWSFRFEAKHYDNLRNSLITAVKTHQDWRVVAIADEARRTPGFAGVRDQLKKLMALARSTWTRQRGNAPLPELPKRFGYVRRIKASKVAIRGLLRSLREAQERYRHQRAALVAEMTPLAANKAD